VARLYRRPLAEHQFGKKRRIHTWSGRYLDGNREAIEETQSREESDATKAIKRLLGETKTAEKPPQDPDIEG
jgi:hypothetical protein